MRYREADEGAVMPLPLRRGRLGGGNSPMPIPPFGWEGVMQKIEV